MESKSVPTGPADPLPTYGEAEPTRAGFGRRFIDSFKRDPNASVTGGAGADGKTFDVENAAANTAASPLHRRLKARHLQMIAIGGSIGMHPDQLSPASISSVLNCPQVPVYS